MLRIGVQRFSALIAGVHAQPRDQFVAKLLKKVKAECVDDVTAASGGVRDTDCDVTTSTSDPEESWEDITDVKVQSTDMFVF